MADSLNKQLIDRLIVRARTVKGRQLELVNERETGLRIRAGERSAAWLLCVRLRNGKRTRIKLGGWPAIPTRKAQAGSGCRDCGEGQAQSFRRALDRPPSR
jgi:hypothetical protein